MRRGLFLLGLGLCLAAAAVAADTAWDRLPYYDNATGRLWYATDGTWSGATPVSVGRSEHPAYPAPFTKIRPRYIWGASCGRARERRTFSKTIMAPGTPAEGQFLLSYGVAPLTRRPWESAALRVNGVDIARLPRLTGVPRGVGSYRNGSLPQGALKAFRHGPNVLTVSATKAALKKGERCNDARIHRYIGVLASVQLQFAADLSVAPPVLPLEVIRNVTNGQNLAVQGTLRLQNAGPSTAVKSELSIAASLPGEAVVASGSGTGGGGGAAPFTDCTSGFFNLVCEGSEFRAGTSPTFPFTIAAKVNTAGFRSGAGRLTISVGVSVKGMSSLNPANNVAQKTIVLCAPNATDPACG